jgi:hypothetical protein
MVWNLWLEEVEDSKDRGLCLTWFRMLSSSRRESSEGKKDWIRARRKNRLKFCFFD